MKKSLLSAVALTAFIAFSGSAWADILIGVAGPITGPNAAFGAQLQKGAEQAVADINAAGGINGQQLKLEIGDDVSDPKQGISVANKFVADGVKFVDGHFKDAKIAIIHDKTPYGQGLADETKKNLNANGIKEVMYEGVNVGDKDFSALIAKMKENNVTLIYWGGLHTEAGLIIRQSADQGLKAPLFSGDGIVSNELASIAGDAVAGTLNTFAPDPRKNPAAKEVVEKFRAAGFEPEAYTLYSYAAVQIISQAIAKAGSADDAQKVAEIIKSGGPWKTAIGEIGYDAKGDITRPDYVIYEWKKGDDGKYSYFEK
ncbi:MAG: branched-chain amino acid ABC transporter substrate-binding protein [Mesorhizobium sp.]|nr:MAG: branched-chain amino acid ABC transporter substrate-binding protein [Mesorhizobium sp.]